MSINFRQVLDIQKMGNFNELVDILELFIIDTINDGELYSKNFRMELIRKEIILNRCIRKAFIEISVRGIKNNTIPSEFIEGILAPLQREKACIIPIFEALYNYCKK